MSPYGPARSSHQAEHYALDAQDRSSNNSNEDSRARSIEVALESRTQLVLAHQMAQQTSVLREVELRAEEAIAAQRSAAQLEVQSMRTSEARADEYFARVSREASDELAGLRNETAALRRRLQQAEAEAQPATVGAASVRDGVGRVESEARLRVESLEELASNELALRGDQATQEALSRWEMERRWLQSQVDQVRRGCSSELSRDRAVRDQLFQQAEAERA